MCYVTATELKKNLSYYLELAKSENVVVTRNNKSLVTIVNTQDIALANFLQMRHELPKFSEDTDYDKEVGEEILEKCGF